MTDKISNILKNILSLGLKETTVQLFYLDTEDSTMQVIYNLLDEVLDWNINNRDKHICIKTLDKVTVCNSDINLAFHVAKGKII